MWAKDLNPSAFPGSVDLFLDSPCLLLFDSKNDARHLKRSLTRFSSLFRQEQKRRSSIGHAPADEIAQPGSFFCDDLGDLTVLLGHLRDPPRLIHPFQNLRRRGSPPGAAGVSKFPVNLLALASLFSGTISILAPPLLAVIFSYKARGAS
jgi:hypothetical protein